MIVLLITADCGLYQARISKGSLNCCSEKNIISTIPRISARLASISKPVTLPFMMEGYGIVFNNPHCQVKEAAEGYCIYRLSPGRIVRNMPQARRLFIT